MSRVVRVQRVQECVVDVDQYQMDEGEDPRVVATELALDFNDWETIDINAEVNP